MSQTGRKEKVSLTLDEDIVERIDTMPGVKRSTLVNEVMNDWLEENDY